MPRLPNKYPVRVWLGKYEAWVLKLYGSRSCKYKAPFLEKFFNHFPEDIGLEFFSIGDLQEYREWRLAEGINPTTLKMELKVVQAFWNYLINDCSLPLFNPVKDEPTPKRKNRLTLEGFKRLILYIDNVDVKKYLQSLATDSPTLCTLSGRSLNALLSRAVKLAGLPTFGIHSLRENLKSNIWRRAMKDLYSDPRPVVTEADLDILSYL